MKIDQLVNTLRNALNAEAKMTTGKDITKALAYNISIVIKDGEIVGYSIDKTEDYSDT